MLMAAQLHNGRVVNVKEVEQGFPPRSDINEIIDLI
jgi:hypothetical protein